MKTDGIYFKMEVTMYKNLILLSEDETYDIYGGKADEIADVIELREMGFVSIAKLIDKIRSAFKDAQRKPANQ